MKRYVFHILSLTLALAVLAPVSVAAQTGRNGAKDRKDVRQGNRDYRKGNYKEAEIDYRKALVKDSLSVAANYNLAAALHRQGDEQGAMQAMQKIEQAAVESGYAADYYYNLGDVALASKDYKTAVEAFAKSLVARPDDLDAKENYIYARKMLENQQQNGGGGQDDQNQDNQQNQNGDQDQNNDKNKDQDNDRNKDNQDKDKQNGDKDNQDKNRNDDGQDDKGQNPPQDNRDGQGQPQEQKISPQAAQQMLQAIQAKEKETQDKVNKEKAAALKARQKEKNW